MAKHKAWLCWKVPWTLIQVLCSGDWLGLAGWLRRLKNSCPVLDQMFVSSLPTVRLVPCCRRAAVFHLPLSRGRLSTARKWCHSLSALSVGGFDGSGPETHVAFGLHTHRRLQIKRIKLSWMEKVVKVFVSSCSPLKGGSEMLAIFDHLWE